MKPILNCNKSMVMEKILSYTPWTLLRINQFMKLKLAAQVNGLRTYRGFPGKFNLILMVVSLFTVMSKNPFMLGSSIKEQTKMLSLIRTQGFKTTLSRIGGSWSDSL